MPWGEMLRAALRLGIAPDAFWRLGVREWRMLAGGRGTGEAGAGGMDRVALGALMAAYPDRAGDHNSGSET